MRYKVGNLIEAFREGEVNIIAHQANCFNIMGAGIARAIANQFPEAALVDKLTVAGDKKKLGDFSLAQTDYGYIFNLYGQYNLGACQESSIEDLKQSLQRMTTMLQYTDAIGLPKLGSGICGRDWAATEKVIDEVLDEYDVTIYVLSESEIP